MYSNSPYSQQPSNEQDVTAYYPEAIPVDPQAKQKQLAQLLMAQSQPQDQQSVGGWAVPQSPLAGLGGMASKLMGTYSSMSPDQQDALKNSFSSMFSGAQ